MASPSALPLQPTTLSRKQWSKMTLMKSFTHIDSNTADVLVTEVRRDVDTGITLMHTFPLFTEVGANPKRDGDPVTVRPTIYYGKAKEITGNVMVEALTGSTRCLMCVVMSLALGVAAGHFLVTAYL